MPNFEDIIKYIYDILRLIFGKNIPLWVSPLVGWLLLVAFLICTIWGLLFALSKIKDLWMQSFKPLFYNPEQKRLVRRRRTFAKHIEYEILRLDLLEDWKDDRFAELEAEVEAQGTRKRFSFIPFLYRRKDEFRREKSLSRALASIEAKFVLVEGEPGSGKSVALRHVAQEMAARAKRSRSLKSIIPIYVNLRELERSEGETIDRNLIEAFVKKMLTRSNDRDVEVFLEEQFKTGIEDGTWFFFFDSFDEIPEILSSTEADTVIRNYGDAIADFLQGGMSTCHGVIASRQFRGPKQFSWPHFRIVALTQDRRVELIRKADLGRQTQDAFIGQLSSASQEIQVMAGNPLFLSLLCEHVRSGHPFPQNAHTVFETYIEIRLRRDEARLLRRFKLDTVQVRKCAENIGFCMAADTGLGLSPTREALCNSLTRQGLEVPDNFDTQLDALEYTKLARTGTGTGTGQPKQFTFAHRRFQEYFATCVALRDLTKVPPLQLLTNARWRETVVVMFQTQPISTLTSIIEEAERLLIQFCSTIPNLINDPIKYLEDEVQSNVIDSEQIPNKFPWPAGSLHLLSALQEGFANHPEDLPSAIRLSISKLILSATELGGPDDQKWALEVAATAAQPILSYALRKAFLSGSQWFREVAYRQASHLNIITTNIAQGIYYAITELEASGRLYKEKLATLAHLSRLHQPKKYILAMNLLLHLYIIDFIYMTLYSLILLFLYGDKDYFVSVPIVIFLVTIINIIVWRMIPSISIYISNLITSRIASLMSYKFLSIMIISIIIVQLRQNYVNNNSHSLLIMFQILLIIIISAMGAFSTVLAVWSATTGYLNSWLLWAILPFYPILWTLLYARVNPSLTRNLLKYSLLFILFSSLFILAILIIVPLMNNKLIAKIMLIIITPLIILYLVIIINMVVRVCFKYLHDWRQWSNWSKEYQKPMTYREFWKKINSYHTTHYRIKMLRITHGPPILLATVETEAFLRRIAWQARKKTINQTASKGKKTKEYKTLYWVEDAALDEICRLLEEIRLLNEDIHLR